MRIYIIKAPMKWHYNNVTFLCPVEGPTVPSTSGEAFLLQPQVRSTAGIDQCTVRKHAWNIKNTETKLPNKAIISMFLACFQARQHEVDLLDRVF